MKLLTLGILLAALGLVKGRDPDYGRIIAAYSTRTKVTLTTSTTTMPFTCARFANGDVCQRRRLRRFSVLEDMKEREESALDGSLGGDQVDAAAGVGARGSHKRDPRIALTVWTTSSSTFTITSTSINSSTTFSLSFFCTVNGAAFPPACG